MFLAIFGLISLWENKYKNFIYYLFIALNIFFLILNIKYLIYVNLILCVLGAIGLKYIYKLNKIDYHKTCYNCHHKNSFNAKYCTKCVSKLIFTDSQEWIMAYTKQCPGCGIRIEKINGRL